MNHTKEQIFQLFVEKLSGSINPEEEHVLEERLRSDAAFERDWRLLEKKATELGVEGFLSGLDADAGLQELKARRGRVNQIRYKRVLAIAAVFLLMFVGIWMFFLRKEKVEDRGRIAELVKERQQSVSLVFNSGTKVDLGRESAGKSIALGNTTLNTAQDALRYTSGDTTTSTLSVPPGATYRIVLSDGTEVWLNADTRLRFPLKFPRASREVEVEGEAYFKVAGNAGAPFIVHTPLTDVKVLGTSFNVNTYEKGHVRTALVEGKVVTQCPDGQHMALTPGYVAEYHLSGGFSSTTFEQEDELSWINGVYNFHDMPIENLVRLAARCYGINIILDKEKFAGKSLTGVLERGKLPEFLNDLAATAHIKYYYLNKDLYLE
ncbi:MAG: FecR family protein [Chitinophagaceae bacterium]|nr:FecR family protein [Chitinophagaceae bacterium]